MVTPVGWFCLFCVLASLLFGAVLGWTFSAVGGLLCFVVILAALPFMFGKNNYEVQLEVEHLRVVAGENVPGKIAVTNVGKAASLGCRLEIPMVNTEDQTVRGASVVVRVPFLRVGATHSTGFILPTERRTVFDIGPAVGIKSDPVRLLRVEKPYGVRSKLFVHPQTIQIPSSQAGMIRDVEGDAIDKISMRDLTFHDIREYRPGDPVRNIDWKATARNVNPHVDFLIRQFEESRRAKIVFALSTNDCDYYNDEEFELAISAMASLGAKAAYDNRDIEIVTSETPPPHARNPDLDIIISRDKTPRGVLDSFSGAIKSPRDLDLVSVCDKIHDKIHDISLAVIGVGSLREYDDIRKAAHRLSSNCALIVVISDPRNPPYIKRVGNITMCSLAVLDDLRGYTSRKAFD
jgi:uncharacterized protein (DUF58 family)